MSILASKWSRWGLAQVEGIQEGDFIIKVNRQATRNVTQFPEAIEKVKPGNQTDGNH